MIVEQVTRVYLDPVSEFDDVIKFQKCDAWTRKSVSTVMVVYESSKRDFKSTVDELTKKVK